MSSKKNLKFEFQDPKVKHSKILGQLEFCRIINIKILKSVDMECFFLGVFEIAPIEKIRVWNRIVVSLFSPLMLPLLYRFPLISSAPLSLSLSSRFNSPQNRQYPPLSLQDYSPSNTVDLIQLQGKEFLLRCCSKIADWVSSFGKTNSSITATLFLALPLFSKLGPFFLLLEIADLPLRIKILNYRSNR